MIGTVSGSIALVSFLLWAYVWSVCSCRSGCRLCVGVLCCDACSFLICVESITNSSKDWSLLEVLPVRLHSVKPGLCRSVSVLHASAGVIDLINAFLEATTNTCSVKLIGNRLKVYTSP